MTKLKPSVALHGALAFLSTSEYLLKFAYHVLGAGKSDVYLIPSLIRHKVRLLSKNFESPSRTKMHSEPGSGRSRLCGEFATLVSCMWWTLQL